MSDIFKTKEVRYIDDYLFLDEFFGGQIKNYVMRCIPETKEILIKLNSYYTQYEIYFVPEDTYIKINIINGEDKRIAYVDYSVEELEDILM